MSIVYTGFTNLDNTGSVLSALNASLNLDPGTFANSNDVHLSDTGAGVAAINNGEWNQAGFKEAEIVTDKTSIVVNNFVDVSVTATSNEDTTVDVIAAKRGTITTGSGDDEVNVSVYSNENTWDNTINVNTGAGNDTITLDAVYNSQYTEFTIDAGAGNDTVDVSDLKASVDDVEERFVDGGTGFDTLVISGEDTLTFTNFEVVQGGTVDAALTVTEDLLMANDDFNDSIALGAGYDPATLGLIFSNVDITLDGFDMMDVQEVDMNILQLAYLVSEGENLTAYTAYEVTDSSDVVHTILTDDSDLFA